MVLVFLFVSLSGIAFVAAKALTTNTLEVKITKGMKIVGQFELLTGDQRQNQNRER